MLRSSPRARKPTRSLDPALEQYHAWIRDSVGEVVRTWAPDAVRRRSEAMSAEFVRRTTDDAASRRYATACPVAGVDHTLYRLRELTLPSGARLLAGVHFRGQALDYPFVGVFAQSHWLSSEEMADTHAALLREFSVFAPRATRWWLPAGRELAPLLPVTPDQHLVLGSLDEIRSIPAPPLPSEWRLRRLGSASEIEAKFADLYREFHRARPDLARAVPPTTTEELEQCARGGVLDACFAGAELVGVVAAKPDAQYGVDAWLMWDIVLARKYCGQGLAPIVERAVLDRLDAARAPFVAGTIDAKNLPSLRTALRVGRRVVGSWVFLTT